MPPAKKATRLVRFRWLLLLPIPLLWCVAHQYGALTFLEHKTEDWRFQLRGEIDPPLKLVYVDVDTLSLNEIGGWPWSRAYLSRMASALIRSGGARAVGFDFVLSDEGVPESVDLGKLVRGNDEFHAFLKDAPPVLLAAAYAGHRFLDVNGEEKERELYRVSRDNRPLAEVEPPELPTFRSGPGGRVLTHPPGAALIDTMDNGTRAVPAFAPSAAKTYYHLAVELARLYWGLPYGALRVNGDALEYVRPDGTVQARVPLRDGQLLEVNWFTPWHSEKVAHYEFSTLWPVANALATGTPDEQKEARGILAELELEDAVVLIGPVDPLFQDLAFTSIDGDRAVPKVTVHGNLLSTIVSGRFLHRLSEWGGVPWAAYLIILILTWAVTACALASGNGTGAALGWKVAGVMALLAYAFLTFGVFIAHDLILPFTAPLGAAFTTSFAGLVWKVVEEQRAKSRIKGMFGTYLAPTVVDQMVESGENPELGGHDAEITAYFSDIQRFSSFSEVLPASKLGELLNEYLTACTDIVQAEMGTLDKYIGDAVVAMFGAPVEAPDHAYRACIASQLVQLQIAELREKWRAEGDKWPPLVHQLRTRIGLNTGVCMIGNMGSRTRFNYTMMGDNVNLAARMESGAKSWGSYAMCTEATKVACEQRGQRVVFRALGKIVVQGRTQPVPVYDLVGLREHLDEAAYECIALFEQGLAKYYARDWAGAYALFERSRELEPLQPGIAPGVLSNPSLVYLELVAEAKANPPPPEWDGRYVMKEK